MGSVIWSSGRWILAAVGIHSEIYWYPLQTKQSYPCHLFLSTSVGTSGVRQTKRQVSYPHFWVSRRCLDWTAKQVADETISFVWEAQDCPTESNVILLALYAVVILCISRRIVSKALESKALHNNFRWLEFRVEEVKQAEIKMMTQDKNVLPLSPMSGR